MDIIGRNEERRTLGRLVESGKPEFLAVYGRRRVGKTFLINTYFNNSFAFSHTGISPKSEETEAGKTLLQIQLDAFQLSLRDAGGADLSAPKDWFEAFNRLEKLLSAKQITGRKVVFIDEIPWMDTPKSNFISAFEHFWNHWGCKQADLLLIVCGSASSWMLENLIDSHGGLYGRVTREMKLSPFTLGETELFLESIGVSYTRYDIAQAYMVFGGTPFYLGFLDPELSLPQSIDACFFRKNAPLRQEFKKLFSSAFKNAERVEAIVRALNTKTIGLSRDDILKKIGMASGGHITESLEALVASDFIVKFVPFGNSKREEMYKLVDPFCLFYLRFVEGSGHLDNSFWSQNSSGQRISSWRGHAFENLCFNHIDQIKDSLGIRGIISFQSLFIGEQEKGKAQIDLVIDRSDNVVNLCEAKFYGGEFEPTLETSETLRKREALVYAKLGKKKTIKHVLITTFGVVRNRHSNAFAQVLLLDDLFG